jgi:4-amino-4-deoxy-L-arabinose transferase-like glycosyltransferase
VIATAIAAVTAVAVLGVRAAVHTDPLERLAGDGDVRAGSWHFPRGGPYVLGVQCSGPCELRVDGRRVARRSKASDTAAKRRRVFEAGVYPVELRGEGRLVWHPPGRRGPLEYVPASSLSPDPPELARFDNPGASIADGIFALLLLAIAVGWVAALAWPWLAILDRAVWIEMAAVFALAVALRLWGMGDAGATWDEDVNWSAGRNYVTNVLVADGSDRSWIWNFEHPPVMKLVVGAGAQLADGYGPARALSAIAMSLACALLVPIGRRLSTGGNPGLWAGALAAMTPHLIGHGQIVGHESFAALWWALAILVALRIERVSDPSGRDRKSRRVETAIDPSGRDRKSRRVETAIDPSGNHDRFSVERIAAVAGAVCGLAIFSRFASGLIGPLVYAILILRAPPPRRLEVASKAAVILPVAALAVGFALWPRLWGSPIAHTLEAWEVLSKPHLAEPFLGELTSEPPLWYFAIYLIVTAPIGLLIAAAVGVYKSIENHGSGSAVLALWLLVPLLVMLSPVRQDGVRYIIPSLLAMAMLAGFGLERAGQFLARFIAQTPVRLTRVLFALLAIYMLVTAARIKPYYIDYYGEHVGGPAGVAAARAFELGWWGEGLHRAVAYINDHAARGERVHKRCVAPSHLVWLRADLWKREAKKIKDADWVLVYSPVGGGRRCRIDRGLTLMFEESAMGAPLVRVYRRQRAEAP